jgi:2-haloacid dehalogenase
MDAGLARMCCGLLPVEETWRLWQGVHAPCPLLEGLPSMPQLIYVFDAYGTLFDVHAAALREREAIGPAWEKLSQTWRTKHIEYTWLHAMTAHPATFWTLAERSLDFASASVGGIPADVRGRLLGAYRRMAAFPEVRQQLARLKHAGAQLAILSNGDPDMLADAVASAELGGIFDAVLSVASAGTFKPQPAVYRLVLERFGCVPADVMFVSSNRWDVAAAKAFGFNTTWVNRVGGPDEYTDFPANKIVRDLSSI